MALRGAYSTTVWHRKNLIPAIRYLFTTPSFIVRFNKTLSVSQAASRERHLGHRRRRRIVENGVDTFNYSLSALGAASPCFVMTIASIQITVLKPGHYGSGQPDFETFDHSLFHELGSE